LRTGTRISAAAPHHIKLRAQSPHVRVKQTLTDSEVRRSETQNKQRAPPHDVLGSANKQANALQAKQSNNPPTDPPHTRNNQATTTKETRNAQRATRNGAPLQQRTATNERIHLIDLRSSIISDERPSQQATHSLTHSLTHCQSL